MSGTSLADHGSPIHSRFRLGSDLSSANRLLFREYPYAPVRVVIFLKANGVAARLLMNGGGLVGIATVSLSKIYCGVRHGLGLRRKKIASPPLLD